MQARSRKAGNTSILPPASGGPPPGENRRAVHLLVMVGVVLVITPSVRAADPKAAALVREANAAYESGDYAVALAKYQEAEADCPECPELAYNEALAHYRQRDFEKARERFNTALATRDPQLEAHCKYNLGNVAYAQALEKLSSPAEAIDFARQAISHYRDALELTPQDEDARANIEMAELLIKDLLDKLKKQQEQQEQQPDQSQSAKDQQEHDQPRQDAQKQDESGEEQPQDETQGQQGDPRQEQQQPEQDQHGDQAESAAEQARDEQQVQAGERREMTPEEAQRMLQAVRDKEAQRREEKARQARARNVPVARDW